MQSDHNARSLLIDGGSGVTSSIIVTITPNPNAKVFLADRTLIEGNQYLELRSEEEIVEKTPDLYAALIRAPYVRRVFVMNNFITIVKSASARWEAIERELRNTIEASVADLPVEPSATVLTDGDDAIRQIMDTYLAPAIAVDGGAIRFHSFDRSTGVVTVNVLGSCHGCPSLINTLQQGIKPMLTDLFPEVTDVVRHLE